MPGTAVYRTAGTERRPQPSASLQPPSVNISGGVSQKRKLESNGRKENSMATVPPYHTNSQEYPPTHRQVYQTKIRVRMADVSSRSTGNPAPAGRPTARSATKFVKAKR